MTKKKVGEEPKSNLHDFGGDDDSMVVETVDVVDAEVKKSPVKKAKKPRPAVTKPKTTRIVLSENDDIPPTGLFLGHNGRGYLVQTGVEVDIPNYVLDIINQAVMSTPIIDPETRQVTGYRNRLRYPYQIVTKG